jgi:hypothetical protein
MILPTMKRRLLIRTKSDITIFQKNLHENVGFFIFYLIHTHPLHFVKRGAQVKKIQK